MAWQLFDVFEAFGSGVLDPSEGDADAVESASSNTGSSSPPHAVSEKARTTASSANRIE
jgi:hypothetical protein